MSPENVTQLGNFTLINQYKYVDFNVYFVTTTCHWCPIRMVQNWPTKNKYLKMYSINVFVNGTCTNKTTFSFSLNPSDNINSKGVYIYIYSHQLSKFFINELCSKWSY